MANDDYLKWTKEEYDAELKKALEAHEVWVTTNGKEGIQINEKSFQPFLELHYQSIAGYGELKNFSLYFDHMTLKNLDFSNTDLTGVVFTGVKIEDSNFQNAKLSGIIQYSKFINANFIDADLSSI